MHFFYRLRNKRFDALTLLGPNVVLTSCNNELVSIYELVSRASGERQIRRQTKWKIKRKEGLKEEEKNCNE